MLFREVWKIENTVNIRKFVKCMTTWMIANLSKFPALRKAKAFIQIKSEVGLWQKFAARIPSLKLSSVVHFGPRISGIESI